VSWKPANNGLPDPGTVSAVTNLAIDPQNSNTLYAGLGGDAGHGGIFRSDDGGATWSAAGQDSWLAAIAVLGGNSSGASYWFSGVLAVDVAGYGSYVFKSTDGGTSWSPVTSCGGYYVNHLPLTHVISPLCMLRAAVQTFTKVRMAD
jgi:hypothetical protein